jgi:two-component system, NarL family, sensor kinase
MKAAPYLTRRIHNNKVRYVLGVLAGIAALIVRGLLSPVGRDQDPYHSLWLAVIFTAWYCGIGPSIVAVLIGTIGVWYWFLPPYHSLWGRSASDSFDMLVFLAFSAVVIAVGEATRQLMFKQEHAEEQLRKAHEGLEYRVKERTAALEQKTAELSEKAALLDMTNDAILVKDHDGAIAYWNHGAEMLYGWSKREALGQPANELLLTQFPGLLREIEGRDYWEGELHHVRRDGKPITVASRWNRVRDKDGGPVGWLEINTDITGRKRMEDATRSLSARILNLQDDERRRIARGLHDSLGQYLAALKMNLHMLAAGTQNQLASECLEIIDKCIAETRTISHLLHPPLLDEAGFGSAARWYVDGFAQRSGIKVHLDLPRNLGRLSREAEIALFRALQEGLSNVHRHASSSKVDIRLVTEQNFIRLEIRDNGHGISPDRLQHLNDGAAETGVGIAGMRERIRELGGALEIGSDSSGTRLRVTIPVDERIEEIERISAPHHRIAS